MFKKLFIACASVAVITIPVGGASAGPPVEVPAGDYFDLFLDVDEGTSLWINITAPDFCGWALGGFMGPAPVVDDALPATLNFTGNDGPAVASIKTDGVYMEVWNLDNPDGPYVGACEDILDQLLAGSDPWATGTTSINARTNNLFFDPSSDEPRGLSTGLAGTAMLDTTDGGDSYRYQFATHFNTHCECSVFNSSLRMI